MQPGLRELFGRRPVLGQLRLLQPTRSEGYLVQAALFFGDGTLGSGRRNCRVRQFGVLGGGLRLQGLIS